MESPPSPDGSTAPEAPTEPSTQSGAPSAPTGTGTTVVGIGASAGGLAALKAFFAHVPEGSGLAFVVVVHLSPEHESHLAEILQPHVRMPVQQVTETTTLRPDSVYVIPPGRNLSAVDTHLRLSDLEEERRQRAPIDHFFRTLAKTHDGNSVAVVLTGTGSDGTLGIREVKQRSGLVVVQDPNEAEYDGMPQSAIATGLADLVLPLAEIPEAILRFARTEPRVPVPEEEQDVAGEEHRLLQKVFAQLRARTGRDVSRYKRSTLLRRIRRRMQMAHLEELPAYLTLLRDRPEEVHALADDLLITVTNFFRDPDVFEALEAEVVPRLFEGKGPADTVRAWSVGCATGEEAYSLAILLLEAAAHLEAPPRLQVFASDLHERSLERARAGFYPGDVEADVSPKRLARFFHKEDGGYRVRKEVRELVVFAPHNLLGDPPFSKLDLIACRNVLIYLQRDVQKEVMELFHYALLPDGVLVLGTSETVEGTDLFRVEDKKRCLYRKRNVQAPEPRLPVFPIVRARLPAPGPAPEAPAEFVAYGALHQRMVEAYAPPSLLLSPDDRVVHLSERAGRYLVHPGGEMTSNALRLVREELRVELRAALHASRQRREPVRSNPVPVRFDDGPRPVILDVRPALEPEGDGFTLVIFDERPAPEAAPAPADDGADPVRVRELEAELDLLRQRLQGIIEEDESSREELKASNEELQSANEELRSTMEELETSKEELQSMNEELQTVNQENRHKVEELAQLSGDLQNLLTATDIATLFLDRELRIMRFTPRVGELFSVRPADRGRPLAHLTHRLGYDEILDNAAAVLRRLTPIEREVQDDRGRWYLTRVLPYRSAADRIEGVVLTFVEITARKEAEAALLESEANYRRLVESAREYAILMLGPDHRITMWNAGAERVFGYTEAEALGQSGAVLFTEEDRAAGVPEAEFAEAASEGRASDDRWQRRKDGSQFWASGVTTAIYDEGGHVRGFSKVLRDNTARKAAEEALRASEARFRATAETVPDILFTATPDGLVDYVNPRFEAVTGVPTEAALGTPIWPTLFHPDDRAAAEAAWTAMRDGRRPYELRHRLRNSDGDHCWFLTRTRPVRDAKDRVEKWFGTCTDIDALVRAEAEVQALNATLEARVEERTREVEEMATRLTVAEQEERERIAQILHDDLQQQLVGLSMTLELLRAPASEEEAARLRGQADEIVGVSIDLARSLATELSPAVLDSPRVEDLLAWLADHKRSQHGMAVEVDAEATCEVPSRPLRVLLFQAVQEALLNVVKHAGTREARVRAREEGGLVVVTVEDEGVGFDPAESPTGAGGFGLYSVRSRVERTGGRVEIVSAPGAGTRVTIRVPASDPASDGG